MPDATSNACRMADLIACFDWASTPLGPLGHWPQSLKTAVDIILASDHAMQLAWGPQRIVLYNDAYARMLGNRHPGALGIPLRAAWPDVWQEIAPRIERVFAGETVRFEDLPMVMTRQGHAEGTWWTFSCSPVKDESGAVAGLLNVTDAAGRIRVERAERERDEANQLLQQNEARFRALVTASAHSMYRMSPDWRVMHELDSDTLASTSGPLEDWPSRYILEEDRPQVFAAIERAIRTRSLFELEHRVRLADGSIGWVLSRAVPLMTPAGEIIEWFGAGSDVTDRKRAESALRESEEGKAFMLALSDALRALTNADQIQRVAARLAAERWGIAHASYARIETHERVDYYTVQQSYAAPGRQPGKGRFRLADFPELAEALRAGRTLAIAEIALDSRFNAAVKAACASLDIATLLMAPLVKDGHLAAIFSIYGPQPKPWTDADAALLEEVAERIWAAVERARVEAALRHSEERLRQFGEASQNVLWIRDAHTLQWQYLTPAFEAIYGLTRQEALGGNNYRSWMDLIVPEDRDRVRDQIRRVRNGEHVTFDYRIKRPADGRIRWLRNTDFPIVDERGNVALIGGIGHDLTELRETEIRLDTLVQGIPQLVWRAVEGGHWTWASSQWAEYTGQDMAASAGWGWLGALHPDDRALAREEWAHAMEKGGFEVEYRVHNTTAQEYRWFQTRATPVRDDSGAIIEWLGTSTDIHALRELQERQRILVAELQHRTRNLMGVVRAMAERTAQASTDIADFRYRFGDRMAALARVQGLLSRLEETDRVAFDELIRTELAAMDGAVGRVTLDGPAGIRLRSSMVQTLAMALHELATNAMKYGAFSQPDGRLVITWRVESPDDRGRPRLHIDWRESGVKMPAADAAPHGSGQGRELIEKALPYQLHARTRFELGPDGVHCTITIPVSATNESREVHG